MLSSMYPFWAAIIALVFSQVVKPLIHLIMTGKWSPLLVFSSGSFPSSHTAMVTALSLSVGLQERFSSSLFAVTMVFAIIISYDAMNVRYYSGKNIEITQQLINDLENNNDIALNDPIYHTHMKLVLGHKKIEVFGGIIIGFLVAYLIYLFNR